jgi:uncharacterized protein
MEKNSSTDRKPSGIRFESPSEWGNGQAKDITFVVTQDCQLQCKYCYLAGKNPHGRMEFPIAKKTIDYLLQARETVTEKMVILDFIGGEPFLEIELIERICDYFKLKTYEIDHPWFENYRINFTTNGLLYNDPKVQQFIKKNIHHLSISMTIDGTKNKHDLQRVFPNNKGSYDEVVKNIPMWLKQFPGASTKVTVARDGLPYIKESVLHLWSLGIRSININVVFEDVWKQGDDAVFEQQLTLLADAIIDNNYYTDRQCSFFSRTIGKPVMDNQNWCGAGKMLAVDAAGDFYPCIRFLPFSLQNKKARTIGNCFDGIDLNKVRPFVALTLTSQSSRECIECDVATGCAWCQGANYDFADSDTIYKRATYLCAMHKARVRANAYFWNKFDSLHGAECAAM